MSEVFPRNILLRVGGRTLARHGVLAVAGARRGIVEVPITFTRADATTCATYIDRDGIVRLAAAGVPRIEWVDLDGDGIRETPGILLEGSRANPWTHSEEINDAVWTKDSASVTTNAGAGADGNQTADIVVEDGTNNLHGFERVTPTLTSSTKQSVSCFASYFGSRTWFRIRTIDKSNTLRSTFFNIGAGAIGTTDAGHTDVKIEGPLGVVGAQGYRCSLVWDSASGATAPNVQFFMATGDNSGAYVGDGVSGMAFWGQQFETDKPFRSSYIKTVASAITRAADSLTIPYNWGPIDFTVLARFARPVHADASGTLGIHCGIFQLGTADLSPTMYLASANRTVVVQERTGGNNAQQAIPAGASLIAVAQFKNIPTSPQAAVDVGSGYSSFSTAVSAANAFGNQTLRVGFSTEGGSDALFGVLTDLVFVRGLHSYAEMVAIP